MHRRNTCVQTFDCLSVFMLFIEVKQHQVEPSAQDENMPVGGPLVTIDCE